MKHIAIIVVLLAVFTSTSYCQDFRLTPNNNEYYSVKYYHKKDTSSLGKFVLIFTVTDRYVPTFTNPIFSWNDGSGILESKMISSGKYQIDLPLAHKKSNSNCITVNELITPRIIDVEVNDIKQQLIKIEYLSNLSRENIYDRISRFNPLEAKNDDLIGFVYNLNFVLRKYDPYCELVLPEVVTGDFSKKVTSAINSWEKTRIKLFYSLCCELSKSIKKDRKLKVDPELLSCLAKADAIKLNSYNACHIEFLINVIENLLALSGSDSAEAYKLILKSLTALKPENLDSTDRFLVVANVVKNGYQQNNLLVAYTPASFRSLDDKKNRAGYFICPSSPSFGIFPEAVYMIWAENNKKEMISHKKLINMRDMRYKEIVFPVNGSLAIVRLPYRTDKSNSFDVPDFYKEMDRLIIKYNCLFISNISISLY